MRFTHSRCSNLMPFVALLLALMVGHSPAMCDDAAEQDGVENPALALPADNFTIAPERDALISETLRLYYLRDPEFVAGLLDGLPGTATRGVHISVPTGGGQPVLLLYGPASQVEQVKRVIATLDVPQPQVELGIWAFQISGTDNAKVSRTAAEAQRLINAVSRLVRGYMGALDLYAQEILQANAEAMRMAEAAAGDDEAPPVCVASGRDILLPSERGPHPLALTEIIATLMCARPEIIAPMGPIASVSVAGVDSTRVGIGQLPNITGGLTGTATTTTPALSTALRAGLIPRMEQWVRSLEETDPEALECWRQLLAGDGENAASADIATALDATLAADTCDEEELPGSAAARQLIPGHLIATLDDPRYLPVVRASIIGFLGDYDAFRNGTVSADRMRMRSADAESVLQRGERALAGDMERLFLQPLQAKLQHMSGEGSGGLGSTSKTSISVLSGNEATVSGSAVSYFNVSMPPQLDASSLASAQEFSDALRGYVPRRSKGSGRVIIYVDLEQAGGTGPAADVIAERVQAAVPDVQCWPGSDTEKESLVLVGDEAKAKWAARLVAKFRPGSSVNTSSVDDELLDSSLYISDEDDEVTTEATSTFGSIGGLPADRLLALAMQFSQQPAIWKALNEGTALTFTPNILPGGSSAELCVNVNVYHNDGGGDEEGTTAPMNRVANHEANTRVYVGAMDLFALSSFSLQTTHPQSDRVIPVLGQLPILGKLFQYKRGPQTVHHESVLMVYSTILPTAADLAATLDWNGEAGQ